MNNNDFFSKQGGKILGGILGLIIALIFVFFGFWQGLFIIVFILAGIFIGGHGEFRRRVLEIYNMLWRNRLR